MERNESTEQLIGLILQPAFSVKDGLIDVINEAAQGYALEAGQSIYQLLQTGEEEYRTLGEGDLYLTLSICDIRCGASVRRMDGFDLFTLEQEADESELQVMSLAAQQLREPLANVMTVAEQLFPVANESSNPHVQDQYARVNRGLYQILRIVGNMSDAYRYSQQSEQRQSVVEITAFMQEIFDKAEQILRKAEMELVFENLSGPVHTLADSEKLERAIHNIISNAVKFSVRGGKVFARLTRRGAMLYLTVQDSGDGLKPELRGNIYARYRRKPGIEDNRFGIGLGMVMIRSAAAAHGGTVLVDHPGDCGTRMTMSIAIRQNVDSMVRSNTLLFDYAGEYDHQLVELSEVLPAEVYGQIN